MGRCKYCGGPVRWKNAAGHFRDFCEGCASDVAAGHDLRARYDPNGDPGEPERPWRE